MPSELILCVPGPWQDRKEFVEAIVARTDGEFIFAGMILACPSQKDHISLDFTAADPQMQKAFQIAGQRTLSPNTLEQLAGHKGVAYLHFPVMIQSERKRVSTFSEALKRSGGFAVKIESSGIAHEWEPWFSILNSDNPFDLYRSFVTLIGDKDYYYSCGMHHFGLPEVEVPRTIDIKEAAELINRFNYWQIVERPKIDSGHTFSISPQAPRYRLGLRTDTRHQPDDLFHNPSGVWNLKPLS